MFNRPRTDRLLALMLPLVIALAAFGAPTAPAGAQDLPPRPPAEPTAPPAPDPVEEDRRSTPQAPARITGTVIDQRTGAPAPGVSVLVGDVTVVSDANGNYDRNGLLAGSYSVALVLGPTQGEATQGPQTVTVAAGQTVVQHLFFRSPEPPVSVPAPVPAPEPVPLPASLPATGGYGGGGLLILAGAAMLALGLGVRRRG